MTSLTVGSDSFISAVNAVIAIFSLVVHTTVLYVCVLLDMSVLTSMDVKNQLGLAALLLGLVATSFFLQK